MPFQEFHRVSTIQLERGSVDHASSLPLVPANEIVSSPIDGVETHEGDWKECTRILIDGAGRNAVYPPPSKPGPRDLQRDWTRPEVAVALQMREWLRIEVTGQQLLIVWLTARRVWVKCGT